VANQKMILDLAGHEVTVSNPGKVYFPSAGVTKLDMVRYYLVVAAGALGGVASRPMALKRFVNGAESEPFFQKRAPEKRPDWVGTVELRFSLRPHRRTRTPRIARSPSAYSIRPVCRGRPTLAYSRRASC
jgi:DNA primase